MTTWTMEQVRQVQRLSARVVVDSELVERYGEDVTNVASDKMAKQLIHMAHPFAVEPHREDFEVVWSRPDSKPWEVVGEMRWHPRTNAVELRGGSSDGQRVAIQRVGDSLRIPRLAGTPFWEPDDTSASAGLVEMADTYDLAGWREDERVWVYAAK